MHASSASQLTVDGEVTGPTVRFREARAAPEDNVSKVCRVAVAIGTTNFHPTRSYTSTHWSQVVHLPRRL